MKRQALLTIGLILLLVPLGYKEPVKANFALTTAQKQELILKFMTAAKDFSEANDSYTAARFQYDALDFGNVLVQGDLDAYAPSANLTKTEFTDGVTALSNISTTVGTNKTNLNKIRLP